MKTIGAAKFKNQCLKLLDEVANSNAVVVITKRGRPVAQLVPYKTAVAQPSLIGSVIEETGDPFSTAGYWRPDVP